MQQGIEETAERLKMVLKTAAFKLPIYVRFHTQKEMVTIGVNWLDLAPGGLKIQVEGGGEFFMAFDDLVCITAFCDRNRKPVFLRDFEGESRLCHDFRAEIDKLTMKLHQEIREWQNTVLGRNRERSGVLLPEQSTRPESDYWLVPKRSVYLGTGDLRRAGEDSHLCVEVESSEGR